MKMNDFNRHNKTTGVHWLRKPLEDVKIRITLKPQNGTWLLPKFEDFVANSKEISLETLGNARLEEFCFKWQEKVFNLHELHYYADVHNCDTETQLTYNEMLKNFDYEPSKVFTYIHEDYYLPLPTDFKKVNSDKSILNLNLCLDRLNLGARLGEIVRNDGSSTRDLFKSEENINLEEEQWTAMHIVFDNSKYNEDSDFLFKQEAVLLSLFHNAAQNCLIVSPDVNNLDLNPYQVCSAAGVMWGYEYGVELEFEEGQNEEELLTLLKNLSDKWERRHKPLISFKMPPLGKKQYHVNMEIVCATDFDMDDLYVDYLVKIPEVLQCGDALKGRTHTSKAMSLDEREVWNFAHVTELSLEAECGSDPPPLQLFFEVISTDWWGRHRTEGYCYLPLTLQPGASEQTLSCSRPEEMDSVEAMSRRFFVGGCHLIKDLDVLTKPQMQVNFKFVTTGTLDVRWSVISQAPLAPVLRTPDRAGTYTASALLLGAETVLRQYRRARARLAAATKDLRGDGDG